MALARELLKVLQIVKASYLSSSANQAKIVMADSRMGLCKIVRCTVDRAGIEGFEHGAGIRTSVLYCPDGGWDQGESHQS